MLVCEVCIVFLVVVDDPLVTVKVKYAVMVTRILLIVVVFHFLFLVVQVYGLRRREYQ